MKTLIIVIHPEIEDSILNKKWIESVKSKPEKYFVHNLHEQYKAGIIDVKAEQEKLELYDTIIFQFPIYWFNCPPLFKKWLDEVLVERWAFGSENNYKLENKKISMALTLGGDLEDYRSEGKFKYSLEELTRPFELTFEYVKADYQPFFAQYGVNSRVSSDWLNDSTSKYLHFLETIGDL